MFSINKPHYYFSAITQPMTRFYVIFSQFDVYFVKDINNLIFQTFIVKGLVDTRYYFIVPSTILISVIYFNFIICKGILSLETSKPGHKVYSTYKSLTDKTENPTQKTKKKSKKYEKINFFQHLKYTV